MEFGEALPPDEPDSQKLVDFPSSAMEIDSYMESAIRDKMKLSPNISYCDAQKDVFKELMERAPEMFAEYCGVGKSKS